jgi:hypothetical protein
MLYQRRKSGQRFIYFPAATQVEDPQVAGIAAGVVPFRVRATQTSLLLSQTPKITASNVFPPTV